MDLTLWYQRVHHNIQVNAERNATLYQFRHMIAQIPVKEQNLFNVHLSELPRYQGRTEC